MSLDVIGSGFGRTGTMSLRVALDRLGLGPCHHMFDLFEKPGQLEHWQAAIAGEPVDWKVVFSDYRSQVDWPGAHFWQTFVKAFPKAKVLHTVRPADRWWESFSTTLGKSMSRDQSNRPPRLREISRVATKVVTSDIGGDLTDRAAAIRAFSQRTEEVKETVPADRLLVFDVAEGWEPLCQFLDMPLPDEPFPHLHQASEFWEKLDSRSAAVAEDAAAVAATTSPNSRRLREDGR